MPAPLRLYFPTCLKAFAMIGKIKDAKEFQEKIGKGGFEFWEKYYKEILPFNWHSPTLDSSQPLPVSVEAEV